MRKGFVVTRDALSWVDKQRYHNWKNSICSSVLKKNQNTLKVKLDSIYFNICKTFCPEIFIILMSSPFNSYPLLYLNMQGCVSFKIPSNCNLKKFVFYPPAYDSKHISLQQTRTLDYFEPSKLHWNCTLMSKNIVKMNLFTFCLQNTFSPSLCFSPFLFLFLFLFEFIKAKLLLEERCKW